MQINRANKLVQHQVNIMLNGDSDVPGVDTIMLEPHEVKTVVLEHLRNADSLEHVDLGNLKLDDAKLRSYFHYKLPSSLAEDTLARQVEYARAGSFLSFALRAADGQWTSPRIRCIISGLVEAHSRDCPISNFAPSSSEPSALTSRSGRR